MSYECFPFFGFGRQVDFLPKCFEISTKFIFVTFYSVFLTSSSWAASTEYYRLRGL